MRETLKDLYTNTLLQEVTDRLREGYPAFDANRFMELVYNGTWEHEEFKQRIRHITLALTDTLPASYPQAVQILQQAAPHFRGVEYVFFPDYVEVNGMEDVETSMEALAVFTRYSTAEFAVRPFIMRDPAADAKPDDDLGKVG